MDTGTKAGKESLKTISANCNKMTIQGDSCSSCVTCPFCTCEFETFANAESFSRIKCPECFHWFHVHIRLGLKPVIYLNPNEFQEEISQGESIFDEEAGTSEVYEDDEPQAPKAPTKLQTPAKNVIKKKSARKNVKKIKARSSSRKKKNTKVSRKR